MVTSQPVTANQFVIVPEIETVFVPAATGDGVIESWNAPVVFPVVARDDMYVPP